MNAPIPHTQVADAAPIQAPDRVGWADIIKLQVAIRTTALERRVRELEAAVSCCPNCGESPCRTEAFCRACGEADSRQASDSPNILRGRRLLDVTLDRA